MTFKKKIYIDGSSGTTGLRIYERLKNRSDLELIELPQEIKKDLKARQEAINNSDLSILCLPDDAAKEIYELVKDTNSVIIDTSTAHRTSSEWTYGFPELTGYKEKIQNSKRIANPGCHASGFISLIAPLVEHNIIDRNYIVNCFSITGYSGGGKKMIQEYKDNEENDLYHSPKLYAMNQSHKHLKEMQVITGLTNTPLFCPIVDDFYSGMQVVIQLPTSVLSIKPSSLQDFYTSYYKNGLVSFNHNLDIDGRLSSNLMNNRDSMILDMYGNDDRITLVSRFDNLGKGASGAAIQNMNIALGLEETLGLIK